MKPQKTDLHASLRLLICLLSLLVSVQSGKKPVSIFRRIKVSHSLNCNLGSIINKEIFKALLGKGNETGCKFPSDQTSAKMTNQFLPRLFVGISRILIDDPPLSLSAEIIKCFTSGLVVVSPRQPWEIILNIGTRIIWLRN